MKKLILNDYERWKKINKEEFSLYDYIFQIIKLKKINSDILFALHELYWPSFIIYKGYIFLKENFSEEKTNNLIKENENVEFWMNLFLTDSYFKEEEETEAKTLALFLLETWQAKLAKDFPEKNFIVKYVYDEENGDYGLTFYQK